VATPLLPAPSNPALIPEALEELIWEVVRVEAPVHLDVVADRVRTCWDFNITRRLREMIASAVQWLQQAGRCERHDEVVWLPGGHPVHPASCIVRVPAPNDPSSVRQIEHIPACELQGAIWCMLDEARTVHQDELIVELARLFGFRRTSPQIRLALTAALETMEADGLMQRGTDGALRPTKE
jgi:hypothetical protein